MEPADSEAAALAKVPGLALLRRLVTALTLTMIAGIIAITVLLWLRLPAPLPPLSDAIALPQGERAAAVTFARDFTVVVTTSGRVLIYDPSGALHRDIAP